MSSDDKELLRNKAGSQERGLLPELALANAFPDPFGHRPHRLLFYLTE